MCCNWFLLVKKKSTNWKKYLVLNLLIIESLNVHRKCVHVYALALAVVESTWVTAGFMHKPNNCPKTAVFVCLKCLYTLMYISSFESVAGNPLYYEGQALCLWRELIRCADVSPILFSASSVNTICAFHFSRLFFPLLFFPLHFLWITLHPSFNPSLLLAVSSIHSLPIPMSWPSENLENSAKTARVGVPETKQHILYIHVSSTHGCDGHVYNVIRLCQTCQLCAVVHLKAI